MQPIEVSDKTRCLFELEKRIGTSGQVLKVTEIGQSPTFVTLTKEEQDQAEQERLKRDSWE